MVEKKKSPIGTIWDWGKLYHGKFAAQNADQILVLDNAHIIQSGTHRKLNQEEGLYQRYISARQEAIGWKLS